MDEIIESNAILGDLLEIILKECEILKSKTIDLTLHIKFLSPKS